MAGCSIEARRGARSPRSRWPISSPAPPRLADVVPASRPFAFVFAVILAALAGLGAGGCSTMRAEVAIDASPSTVWRILTDLDRYDDWNPFFTRAEGRLEPGQVLHVAMRPVGKADTTFSPTVLEVAFERQLSWRGRLGVPGLFDGEHHFRLEPTGGRGIRLVQEEHFSGLLVPFVGFEPYRLGWVRMNVAIKRRAEEAERGAGRSR